MKKLFLLDAYSCIYRAYYAFLRNPRINSQGLNTSTIMGVAGTIEYVMRHETPTHIAVAFDPPHGKTFRHEQYPEYKAGREQMPEDIRAALPYVKELLRAYRIPEVMVEGYEADDVIGTLATRAAREGYEVYMLTPDKDYAQLAQTNVNIYRPRSDGGYEILDETGVCEKYGLTNPRQMIDYLALMGDKADNIPGCPGVGEKTASKLLGTYRDIEEIIAHAGDIKGALGQKIAANAEQIRFSHFLATIRTDVPIDEAIEAYALQPADEEALQDFYNRLELRRLAARRKASAEDASPTAQVKKEPRQASLFGDEASETATAQTPIEAETTEIIEADGTKGLETRANTGAVYRCMDTAALRQELMAELLEAKVVGFDTEATSTDAHQADIVGMSFATAAGRAYYVPLPQERQEAERIMGEFRPFFDHTGILKVGQNLKYDRLMIRRYGVDLRGETFDTLIAHYLLQPEQRHSLDALAETYLGYRTIHYDELFNATDREKNIRKVDLGRLTDYAAEDADIALRLYEVFCPKMEAEPLKTLFHDIEMPLQYVLIRMEENGVRVDAEALGAVSEDLTGQLNAIEQKIYAQAGERLNISSPQQVGRLLFETLGLDPKAKKTRTGQYSTSEETLERLRTKHPVVGSILDYRGLKKLLSTYIDALPKLTNPVTGRIHTSYNQATTSTGRLSSSSPNLQNIPIRDELGRDVRKAFVADPGEVFLSADYSQVELRLMAHFSEDPTMIAAFTNGEDIHRATAAKIYKVSPEDVTSDMRRKAKTANFGIIYGISAFGLSRRLDIPTSEAKMLIDGYFETYPAIKAYIENCIREAGEQGYVSTILGRRRYLENINSKNAVVRGFDERNAVNAPIQGSAADLIKIAMIRIQKEIDEKGYRAKMLLQVHDELNFTVPKAELETVREMVRREMENVYPALRVPLTVDCGVGENWLEAH